MSGHRPPDVVLAVPARDEETRIADCLSAVLAAARRARTERVVGDVFVAVAAHRCRERMLMRR